MNNVKHLPALEACGWFVRQKRTDSDPAGWLVADCSPAKDNGAAYAERFAASGCLIDALLLVATKTVLPSGIRAVVDNALAKAGVCAPEPVRHITIAGDAR